jgi:RimJ/RimL family protein N-acetyltransferase
VYFKMRDNWNISITGNGIILVPYKRKFVENYHNWMKDPFLLESTASEELPIEEEYAMQKLWHVDPKKCTFIILATVQDTTGDESASASMGVYELDRMVGDVNLFMNDYDDSKNAEIEIMIAEPRYRRCGLAREALKLMIHYGINQLKLTRFFAKIGEKNVASIELFKR